MNQQTNIIRLEATLVRFYSPSDESAFFDWLKKIPSIHKIEGHGTSIYIDVDEASIEEDDLRELLSLFRRYEIDMSQLIKFNRQDFIEWFENKNSYWYKSIFI